MGYLEGNFTPVLYMGRKVPKGLYVYMYVYKYICINLDDLTPDRRQ